MPDRYFSNRFYGAVFIWQQRESRSLTVSCEVKMIDKHHYQADDTIATPVRYDCSLIFLGSNLHHATLVLLDSLFQKKNLDGEMK